VRDEDDFSRLDAALVAALQQARVDTSVPPLAQLQRPSYYEPQQQQLAAALKALGGMERLLRDSLSATVRLQGCLNHLPSGSNIEALLQQEVDFYLSGSMPLLDREAREGSNHGGGAAAASGGTFASALEDGFGVRVGSGSSGGGGSSSGGMPRLSGSVHGAGGNGSFTSGGGNARLRRSSSSAAARLRQLAVEPYMVLRNNTVRAEWRAVFGGRERVPWKDFWHKLVQPQAHIWGLDRQLDKFTTEYVQQHLQRGSRGLLTLAELDFAFPPNVSPAMVVQARLKGHPSSANTSAGLGPVGSSGGKGAGGAGPGAGAVGAGSARSGACGGMVKGVAWLPEVMLLQEPNPRLHNFPEVVGVRGHVWRVLAVMHGRCRQRRQDTVRCCCSCDAARSVLRAT
jgi:hypothetical protein